MAMMPKRVKFRKSQRGKMKGNATRGNYVAYGEFGLQALGSCWIPAKTLEAARVAVSHAIGRTGRYFPRVFPHKSVSSKPLEVRMGSGKGEPEFWCAVVKTGTVICEIGGVDEITAKRALARVANKLPIRCRLVARRHTVA